MVRGCALPSLCVWSRWVSGMARGSRGAGRHPGRFSPVSPTRRKDLSSFLELADPCAAFWPFDPIPHFHFFPVTHTHTFLDRIRSHPSWILLKSGWDASTDRGGTQLKGTTTPWPQIVEVLSPAGVLNIPSRFHEDPQREFVSFRFILPLLARSTAPYKLHDPSVL